MADIYVRSTDGNNSDNGSTWALAKATLVGAAGIDVQGDSIYLSQVHAESTAGAVAPALAGVLSDIVRVVCVNDGAAPPTAQATTATVTTTGANSITLGTSTGNYLYFYGISFIAGSGSSGTASIIFGGIGEFEACNFTLASTGASSLITLGTRQQFKDCWFKFGAAGQKINGTASFASSARFQGGGIAAGGTSPTVLLSGIIQGQRIEFDGFDLSNCANTVNLCSDTVNGLNITLRNCKLPSSWSGQLFSGASVGVGSSMQLFSCDSGDTTYRYRKAAKFGSIQDETTLVRTGGASDGTTTISHKVVTNADAEYPMLTMDSPPIVQHVSSGLGASKTATIEILRDSATNLKDDEVWMELTYYGTSGVPLSSVVSDCKAGVVATAADQASSSATWTTTGMANPNKQKLSVTFTPQEAGYVEAVVKVAKASTTVYYDPKITIA